MKLSIVIPCYNAAETIAEQLEAISKQQWEYTWEVIVADNGSSDNTLEIVKKFEDKIRHLRTVDAGKKKGPSYARNFGVEHSTGEYISFVDADDVVGENWLKSMGSALLKHDFVACRMEWSKLNKLSDSTLKAKIQTDGLVGFSLGKFLPFAGAGTLGVKKSIHAKVGGFDETLRFSADPDYTWKIQLKGHELTFLPQAVIHIRSRIKNFKVFKQYMNWGEHDVYLYERYKHHGIPDYTTKKSLRSLYHVSRNWRDFFSPKKKRLWILRFGQELGRFKGMIKNKYLRINKT